MKLLSHLFFVIMLSVSTMLSATDQYASNIDNINNLQEEIAEEIAIDESVKAFIQDLCDVLTLQDYVQHVEEVEALFRCSERLLKNYDSLLLRDLKRAYPLLADRYNELIQESIPGTTLKAPREQSRPFIAGPLTFNISSIRNLLDTILVTLNQCCNQINNNFVQTFSLLNDISLTISAFSGETLIEAASLFVGTVTLLVELTNTLTTIITNDFQGSFTALDACCENITSEFQQTWSILDAGFNGTYSALNACCENITSEFQQTWTILNEILTSTQTIDLNPIFTALENLAACFATSITAPQTITVSGYYCLANNVNGSFVIAADNVTLDLNSHTITGGGVTVNSGMIGPVIKNGAITASTVGIVLNNTTNGVVQNVSITASPSITGITSSGSGNIYNNIYIGNVTVGFSSNSDSFATIDGVTIANTTGIGMFLSGIADSFVKNINISNATSNGMECEGDVLYTVFTDIIVTNCSDGVLFSTAGAAQLGCDIIRMSVSNLQGTGGVAGIRAQNAQTFRFISCDVQECDSSAPFNAFEIDAGSDNVFEDCVAAFNGSQQTLVAFQIGSSRTNLYNCVAIDLGSNLLGGGGYFSSGSNNTFENCSVTSAVITPQVSGAGSAFGFRISGANNVLINCLANEIMQEGNNSGNSAFGYWIQASNTSLYNCIANQCTNNIINAASGFMINSGNTNTLLVNCSATNGNGSGFNGAANDETYIHCIATGNQIGFNAAGATGYTYRDCTASNNVADGFQLAGNSQTFISCSASQNGGNGFDILSGQSFNFRDCTAILNNIGFNAPASVPFLFPINCVATNNTTSDEVNFPNFAATGSAGPAVVGQNIAS